MKPSRVNTVNRHSDARVIGFEKKLTACNNFLISTLNLKKALEKDEPKAVAKLIKRRAGLIATMDALDKRMAYYPQPSSTDRISDDMATVGKIAEEINERLRQAIAVNQECETIAARRREELTNELAAVNREAKGFRGYIQRGKQTPKFLNIRT